MIGFNNLYRNKYRKILFTTPSHSQKFCITNKFKQFYKYDISETDTHNPEKLLKEAELKAANIYGVKQTKFLTNGSTSGIITAVLSAVNRDENILLWSDAHPSHKNAADLAGANIIYYNLPFNEFGVSIQVYDLEKYFVENKIKALLVTSPTYEGYVADIKSLKSLCDKYNALLIIDEAHGALYPFSDRLPESAIKYADIIIQSLHKTAGGLNPTALIHSNCEHIDLNVALSKINTTSPSYPLLMSIENNINFLNSKRAQKHINNLIDNINEIKSSVDFKFGGDDPTKILLMKEGLSGYELSKILYSYGIEDEIANEKSVMLLTGIGTKKNKLNKLKLVLNKI